MPALASPSTWRTHPQRYAVRAYILTPDVVVSRRVNQSTFIYPLTQLNYDNPDANGGDPTTDVEVGMTVRISDSSGNFKGLGRITFTPATTHFLIAATSQGTIAFADNDIIEVLNEFRPWARTPHPLADGTLYMDWNNRFNNDPDHMRPKANGGPWYGGAPDPDTGLITVDFDAGNSYALANMATIDTVAWEMRDGTITVGTSSDEQVTATFPAGYRFVKLTVTDTNGTSSVHHILVVNDDGLSVEVTNLAGDVTGGWGCALRLLEADTSDFIDGAAVIVWAEETYGTTAGSLNGYPGREHVKFCGWLTSDKTMMETRLDTFLDDSDFVAESAMGILDLLPAFSMTLQRSISPTTWFDVVGLDWNRITHHFMEWHSNILTLCDVEPPAVQYDLLQYDSDPGVLKDQIGALAEAVASRMTVDHNNRIYFRQDPVEMNEGELANRGTTVALTDADWTERVEVNRVHHDPVGALEAYAIIASSTEITAIKVAAPGSAPGQGGRLMNINRRLVQDTPEFKERMARRFAYENLKDKNLPISVLNGGVVADPAWGELITFTTTAPNRRGLAYTGARFMLWAVRVSYDHSTASCQEEWDLRRLLDAAPTDAIEIQMPGADPPADLTEDYIPSGGTYAAQLPIPYEFVIPPEIVPDILDELPVLAAPNIFAWGEDFYFGSALGDSAPSWTKGHDVTSPEAVLFFVLDHVQSDPDVAVLGWLLTYDNTDTYLKYNDDILGVGSWALKQTVSGKEGRVMRPVAGEANGIAFSVLVPGTPDTYSDALTSGLGDDTHLIDEFSYNMTYLSAAPGADGWGDLGLFSPDSGSWVGSVGRAGGTDGAIESERVTTNPDGSDQIYHAAGAVIDLGSACQVTEVSFWRRWESQTGGQVGVGIHVINYFDEEQNLIHNVQQTPDSASTSWVQETISGTVDGVRYVGVWKLFKFDKDFPSLNGWVDDIAIDFTPHDTREIVHSDDTGDTINTVSVGNSGGALAPLDPDDFDLGIFMCSDGRHIDYTTLYTDASSTRLSGLTGIDGAVDVTCIRVPFKKILTQQNNDDATALQFVYGVSDAVDGATLWAVTFNSSTGAVQAQVDITPIVSSVTYYPINENAFATAGGNTQVMAMLGRPVGGGDTDLLLSTDGGATWAVVQSSVSHAYLEWLPGSSTQLFLAGGSSLDYSPDRGVTLIDQTGDIPENADGFTGLVTS